MADQIPPKNTDEAGKLPGARQINGMEATREAIQSAESKSTIIDNTQPNNYDRISALKKINPDITDEQVNQILASFPTGGGSPTDTGKSGSSPTDTIKPAGAETTSQAAEYKIQSGDTLSKIAQANGTNIQAIQAANPQIKNPNIISTGSTLKIPGAPAPLPNADKANKYQNDLHNVISKVADTSDGAKVAVAAASVPFGDPTLPPVATATVNDLIGTISQQITTLNQKAPVDLVENYKSLSKELGIDDLNTEYMNTEKIINGTEDDIRAEVTKAGGMMSESQVEALAASRNKTLILKANALQSAIATKTDTLKTLSSLSIDEQKMASDRVNTAVGLEETLLTTQQTMQTHAADGYNKIVTNVGYTGLAGALKGDPYSQALAEKSLMLPPGTLSNPEALTKLETYRQQTLKQGQQKINISVGNAASLAASRDALTLSRYSTAANNVIRALYPTNKNPIQLYNNSSQVINRIDESYKLASDPKNKDKAAPDLDLVDAYVSIARGGQQISEAQVATLLGGLGIQAKFDVATQKITGTGTLDSGTRKSLYDLSHNIYTGQKKLADEGVQLINERLSKTGVPQDFLFTSPEEIGDTTQYSGGATVNGKQYNAGSKVNVGGTQLIVQPDGTLLAPDGGIYDADGNALN